jgi:hypothetical protein
VQRAARTRGGKQHTPVLPAAAVINIVEPYINFIDFLFVKVYIDFMQAPAAIETASVPAWFEALSDEEREFVRRFVLSSGSLKALADEYGVSYPTVRARIDRLIAKVRAATDPRIADPFQRKLRVLVADGQIASETARALLEAHRSALRGGK